jgi:hypothetical protein
VCILFILPPTHPPSLPPYSHSCLMASITNPSLSPQCKLYFFSPLLLKLSSNPPGKNKRGCPSSAGREGGKEGREGRERMLKWCAETIKTWKKRGRERVTRQIIDKRTHPSAGPYSSLWRGLLPTTQGWRKGGAPVQTWHRAAAGRRRQYADKES